jgi:hypothetical protein
LPSRCFVAEAYPFHGIFAAVAGSGGLESPPYGTRRRPVTALAASPDESDLMCKSFLVLFFKKEPLSS